MICTVYWGRDGLILVPDCMIASREAERAFGPLRRCGSFDTDGLAPDLAEHIDREIDLRSFIPLRGDLALRLGSTIARDITERNRNARRLAESQRRLASIIEQTTVGVAQTDLEGRFELVNPRYCEIVGRSAEELIGTGMKDITHPNDAAAHVASFRTLIAGGAPFNIENRYVRPDSEAVWVSNYISLIHDDEGKPAHAVVVVLDITERKLAAEH